ncbi:MAG: AzlD domain-containing protein [Halieaceae bacterium]|jgi:branched-subunit amino acid transport protein|nr:AzlD domain-containing protein [Halieaceae bacterium]
MSAFIAILITALGTYASRAIFIVALAQRRFPPLALRTLEYVAPAVMGALIVAMLTTAEGEVRLGAAELLGLLVAAAVARATRNHVLTLFAAMATFWIVNGLF